MIDKLILGTVQFGLSYGINNKTGQISQLEANQVLNLCDQFGLNKLDTASSYGDSERIIGEFIRQSRKQISNKFEITTKLNLKDKTWMESIKSSLHLLAVPKVEVLLFHSLEDYLLNKQNFVEEIVPLKGQFYSKVGVSVYENNEIDYLLNEEEIEVIQCPFSLLDNQQHRGEVLQRAKMSGKIIHTRSCFLQGLFFIPLSNLPDKFKPILPQLEKLKQLSIESNLNLGHIALKYTLSKPYIDGVLIGVDSLEQLKLNLKWAENEIEQVILDKIDELFTNNKELLNPTKWRN